MKHYIYFTFALSLLSTNIYSMDEQKQPTPEESASIDLPSEIKYALVKLQHEQAVKNALVQTQEKVYYAHACFGRNIYANSSFYSNSEFIQTKPNSSNNKDYVFPGFVPKNTYLP